MPTKSTELPGRSRRLRPNNFRCRVEYYDYEKLDSYTAFFSDADWDGSQGWDGRPRTAPTFQQASSTFNRSRSALSSAKRLLIVQFISQDCTQGSTCTTTGRNCTCQDHPDGSCAQRLATQDYQQQRHWPAQRLPYKHGHGKATLDLYRPDTPDTPDTPDMEPAEASQSDCNFLEATTMEDQPQQLLQLQHPAPALAQTIYGQRIQQLPTGEDVIQCIQSQTTEETDNQASMPIPPATSSGLLYSVGKTAGQSRQVTPSDTSANLDLGHSLDLSQSQPSNKELLGVHEVPVKAKGAFGHA